MNFIASANVLPAEAGLLREFAVAPGEAIPEFILLFLDCRNTGFLNVALSSARCQRRERREVAFLVACAVVSKAASMEDITPSLSSIIVIV